MSDDADRAEVLIEHAVDDALAEAHARADLPEVEATGYCLFCYTPLLTARRWCNANCRDAWQHEHDLNLMKGVG